MTHRCEDCGTPLVAATGFGLPPTDVVDGRAHTHGGCVEYLKAARMGAEREIARLRVIIPTCTRGPKACDVELDRYKTALERIVELGEDATSNRRDLMRAFKIADDALQPPAVCGCGDSNCNDCAGSSR